MKKILTFLLALIIMPGVSMACSSSGRSKPPVVQDIANAMMHSNATSGFVGKVELVSKKEIGDDGNVEMKFKVLKHWRGENVDKITMIARKTTCGIYQLDVGQVDILSPTTKNDDGVFQITVSGDYTGLDAVKNEKLEKELDKVAAEDKQKPEVAQ